MLHYYGLKGFSEKAWEKLFVDPKRFQGKNLGEIPYFPKAARPAPLKTEDNAAEPLSILYLIHYFFPERQGGTERFVLNQAREQQRRGNKVRVLTLTVEQAGLTDSETGGMKTFSYEYEGIPVTAFCYPKTPLGLYYKRIESEDPVMEAFAREQLDDFCPSVIHCAYGQPFSAFLKVCRQRRIPYLVTCTGYDSFCHYTTMLDKNGYLCPGSDSGKRCKKICPTYGVQDYEARWRAARDYLQGAVWVTAPSAYVADVLSHEFPGLQVRVVAHGINGPAETPARRSGPVKNFAFVGTLTELKGIPLLIRAFHQVKGKINLSVYGGGTDQYTDKLKRLAACDKRICLKGPLGPEQIQRAYAQTDCVIVPSLVPETYNFVIREALQNGCLVIGSRLGAITEAVRPSENGFLFEPGNETDLARALCEAVKFDWEHYVFGHFSTPKEEAEQYRQLYGYAARIVQEGRSK